MSTQCFPPMFLIDSLEQKLIDLEKTINSLNIEIHQSDSLYKKGIRLYCNNIMNNEIKTFTKEKGIHILLDESIIIYAKDKNIYTNELILILKNRNENKWQNEELLTLSDSLKNDRDIFNKKIKEIIRFIFKISN